jgi:hypothetical protein
MLNFRVRDLDAMLAQLRAAGITIDRQEAEQGVGRFAWLVDPEGNRIELWEPAPDVLEPLTGVADPRSNATGRDHQLRSLVLCVDLVGSRRIWPGHVGGAVDLVGSRTVLSDRLDDQADDQARQAHSMGRVG